jgi:peptidoglycan hydrolase CwlO-like protein
MSWLTDWLLADIKSEIITLTKEVKQGMGKITEEVASAVEAMNKVAGILTQMEAEIASLKADGGITEAAEEILADQLAEARAAMVAAEPVTP